MSWISSDVMWFDLMWCDLFRCPGFDQMWCVLDLKTFQGKSSQTSFRRQSYSISFKKKICVNNLTGKVLNLFMVKFQNSLLNYLFADVEVPPDSRGKKLPIMYKVPIYPPTVRPYKMQKRLRLMRGPETIHTELLHKQYGVMLRKIY